MSEANLSAAPESAPSSEPAPVVQAPTPAETPNTSANTSSETPEAEAPETGNDAADERKKREGNSAAYWRRQAERLQRQNDQMLQRVLGPAPSDKPQAPAPAPENASAPRPEQFHTYEQYIDALTDWKVDQRISSERSKAETTKQSERVAQNLKAFQASVSKAEAHYPDMRDVIDTVMNDTSFPVSPAMAEAIFESEKSAELAYWLGKNPDEARRISSLSSASAARELGRIEATLSTPPKRTVTQAPPPPKTLKGGETPAKDPSKMDMSEYVAWRKSQSA